MWAKNLQNQSKKLQNEWGEFTNQNGNNKMANLLIEIK